MFSLSKVITEAARWRNFFILTMTLLLGQIASGFLLISLISSVFLRTGSNFSVSGIVLSLAVPNLILMAVAGLVADLVDRRKLIIAANSIIAVVVVLILLTLDKVFATIFLSFLYFAGNTFFFPAISAASAQIVNKSQLAVANSVFVFTLAGGQLAGLFFGSVSLFLFGHTATLIICEIFLIAAIIIPFSLPRLLPRKPDGMTIGDKIADIAKAFTYIFSAKITWFFFFAFAAIQGVVAFGGTLGPGYFDEVVSLSIEKSPMFIFPPIAAGVLFGSLFVHNPKIKNVPPIIDHLCHSCREHFKSVLEYLDDLEISYDFNPRLVRGLDYYTKTVFEIIPKDKGSSLGGGGRYDYLIENLGGRATPAVGAALGMERIIEELKKINFEIEQNNQVEVFLICLGALAKKKSLPLLFKLSSKKQSISIPKSQAFPGTIHPCNKQDLSFLLSTKK